MARPSTYKVSFNKIAKKMCELGATDIDLADVFEVDVRTIHRWKIKYSSFCHSLRLGKDIPDARVERALYERAIGFSHDDTDIRVIEGRVVETPITKHYPPDTKAALAWLYNRKGDNWHPQPEQNQENDNDLAEALSKLADKLPD
jgi:hypothetical protein